MNVIAENVCAILTHKKHRSGPRNPERDKAIIENIERKILKNESVKLLQFWGGAKNPNLPIRKVDDCERKSLGHLFEIHKEIENVYPPGLSITICSGGRRVEYMNDIPREYTTLYEKSLENLANDEKYEGLFTLVPVEDIYDKLDDFWKTLKIIEAKIRKDVDSLDIFPKLLKDASSNVYPPALDRLELSRARESAIKCVSVMLSEETVNIYRDFDDCIRSFFVRFNVDYRPIYDRYLPNVDTLSLNSRCALYFYSGSKGNITQPWQAIAKKVDGKLYFVSPRRFRDNKFKILS